MGRLSDALHNLKRLSVLIHVFRKLLSHRRFSSSLSTVAGSDISEPLSNPFITYPVGVVFWKYAKRFPKGYRKSAFRVVEYVGWRYFGGSVRPTPTINMSVSSHSGSLGPSFLIGSSQKVTQPTTYHVCQQPFIYSVTIPIHDLNCFLASYLSSLFGLSSEAFRDVCHTHSTTSASTHSCILGICRKFLLGHSRFSFHAACLS